MSGPWCEQGFANELGAPQPNCGCRACYRERERSIPEVLRQFIHDRIYPPPDTFKIAGPAITIVHNCLLAYASGRVSLEEVWVEIVKQLVTQNDALFDQLCQIEMLKPVIPHLFHVSKRSS